MCDRRKEEQKGQISWASRRNKWLRENDSLGNSLVWPVRIGCHWSRKRLFSGITAGAMQNKQKLTTPHSSFGLIDDCHRLPSLTSPSDNKVIQLSTSQAGHGCCRALPPSAKRTGVLRAAAAFWPHWNWISKFCLNPTVIFCRTLRLSGVSCHWQLLNHSAAFNRWRIVFQLGYVG